MASNFQIGFLTDPEMVRNPPPEYRHLRLTFCPVGIQVGSLSFPPDGWCDFAGILLLRWAYEVWNLSDRRTRAARLIFFGVTNEVWIRRTPSRWWKVSGIQGAQKPRKIETETLCTPERIEAAILSASQRFIAGVRQCGVWGQDCEELTTFLADPDEYVEALREAHARQTAAAQTPDPLPPALRARLRGNIPTRDQEPFPAASIQRDVHRAEIRSAHLPIFCPHCEAVLAPWVGTQTQQTCQRCGSRIRIR
jgi:hypothetical protein